MMMCDKFITGGDVRGGVGPRTTHVSYQKVDLITDRHDGFLSILYSLHRIPHGIIIG